MFTFYVYVPGCIIIANQTNATKTQQIPFPCSSWSSNVFLMFITFSVGSTKGSFVFFPNHPRPANVITPASNHGSALERRECFERRELGEDESCARKTHIKSISHFFWDEAYLALWMDTIVSIHPSIFRPIFSHGFFLFFPPHPIWWEVIHQKLLFSKPIAATVQTKLKNSSIPN